LSSVLVLGDTNQLNLALFSKEIADILIISVERKVSDKECMPFTGDDSLGALGGSIGRRLNSSRGVGDGCFAIEGNGRCFSSGFLKNSM
jgi:hypothetical protein